MCNLSLKFFRLFDLICRDNFASLVDFTGPSIDLPVHTYKHMSRWIKTLLCLTIPVSLTTETLAEPMAWV